MKRSSLSLLLSILTVVVVAGCGDTVTTPTMPAGSTKYLVRVVEILPNPVGSDDNREEVTLRNFDTVAISLNNWRLRDNSGGVNFPFGTSAGIIGPGELKTITHNGTAVLNNSGESLVLVDDDGETIQSLSYTTADEGQVFKY